MAAASSDPQKNKLDENCGHGGRGQAENYSESDLTPVGPFTRELLEIAEQKAYDQAPSSGTGDSSRAAEVAQGLTGPTEKEVFIPGTEESWGYMIENTLKNVPTVGPLPDEDPRSKEGSTLPKRIYWPERPFAIETESGLRIRQYACATYNTNNEP